MFASSDAMSSQNQIPNGSAILLRFSDILRPQVIAHVQAKYDTFIKELPGKLMQICESLPDSQQQKYMDIIVILRHHGASVSDQVTPLCNQQWKKFQDLAQNNNNPAGLAELSVGNMSLVDSDELEQSVVLDTLAARLAGQINELLADTFNRLQVLAPALKQSDQLPFHPRTLLQIVPDSFASANITTDQSIILIKQFADVLDIKALVPVVEQALLQGQVPEAVSVVRNSAEAAPEQEKEPDLVDVLRDIRDLNKKNAGSGGGAGAASAGNASGALQSELNTDPSAPSPSPIST